MSAGQDERACTFVRRLSVAVLGGGVAGVLVDVVLECEEARAHRLEAGQEALEALHREEHLGHDGNFQPGDHAALEVFVDCPCSCTPERLIFVNISAAHRAPPRVVVLR